MSHRVKQKRDKEWERKIEREIGDKGRDRKEKDRMRLKETVKGIIHQDRGREKEIIAK